MLPAVVALLLAPAPALDADGFPLPPEAVRRFGSLRWYADPPRSVAFSPDGKVAYLVPVDHGWFIPQDRPPAVTAWEYPSGRPLWTFTDPDLTGLTVAADPDGKTVWLAAWVGGWKAGRAYPTPPLVRIKLSADTGREQARVKLEQGWSTAHALRPDGTLAWNKLVLKTKEEGDVTVRVLKPDGTEGAVWDPDADMGVSVMKFAPDGKTLFVTGPTDQQDRGRLAAVDPATGKKKWAVGTFATDTLAVSPDGKTLAAVTCSPLLPLPRHDKRFFDEQKLVYSPSTTPPPARATCR